MDNVTCNFDIQPTDPEDIFGDGWDFTIGIYQFQKVSDTRVRVTFTYRDEVTRVDDDGVTSTGHSTWTEEYIKAEENLQTLLDLICFQTSGIGLRIVRGTREMRSTSITSNRLNQTHAVNLRDHADIQTRYDTTIQDYNENLLDALRLNRLAANEENDGERIGQLWGAVERLYASDPPMVLDTVKKREEIQNLIDQAKLITAEDKKRLKNTINNTYKVSKPSVIAEKFGLVGGDGQKMSTAEVKQKLDYWLSTRSIQSHGVVLMRNHDVNMLAGEMEHIMETALSAEVKPSKYVYIVYKPSEVEKTFLSSQRAVTKQDKKSGFSYTPLHKFAAFSDMTDRLRQSLSHGKKLYVVEFQSITKVERSGDTYITTDSLGSKALVKLVNKLQAKLN